MISETNSAQGKAMIHETNLAQGKAVIFETNSVQETFDLAKRLGEQAKPGALYTLSGDLGVGKTVFAQGLAAGLGIAEPVNSPTFTILQVYDGGRLPFYHFDVYRIGDIEEMDEIGCEDCFYGTGVCLVEWAEQISELLPEARTQLLIEKDPKKGFDYRRITLREVREGRVMP